MYIPFWKQEQMVNTWTNKDQKSLEILVSIGISDISVEFKYYNRE